MKAIVQDSYGSPSEVLRLEEVDQPVPSTGEVLIRVHAAAVDAGVWHLTTGLPYLIRLGFGLRAPRTRVRGMDVAGRVTAVGPGVTRFQPDDEVYGSSNGSFAEYACTSQDKLALKPANLDFGQAAAVPVSASTALQALRDTGRVQNGQSVLVIGAAGGVGTFAVQLAKAFGAHVTGVCRTDDLDLVREIGADEVIDYTRQEITDGGRRYDLVLDIAGNRPVSLLRSVLIPSGTLVIVGGETDGKWLGGIDRQLRALLLSLFIRHRLTTLVATQRHDDLRLLAELIESGSVTPVIARTYPLADVARAMQRLREGHVRGKILIQVQEA